MRHTHVSPKVPQVIANFEHCKSSPHHHMNLPASFEQAFGALQVQPASQQNSTKNVRTSHSSCAVLHATATDQGRTLCSHVACAPKLILNPSPRAENSNSNHERIIRPTVIFFESLWDNSSGGFLLVFRHFSTKSFLLSFLFSSLSSSLSSSSSLDLLIFSSLLFHLLSSLSLLFFSSHT